MSFYTSSPGQNTRPTTKQYTCAAEPFDTSHADMIIRSSDFVEFRVHKSILTVSSPQWESTIQSMQNTAQKDGKGRLIVKVGEDSNTLDLLLRIIYPTDSPPIETVFDAFSVLEAARKYEMVHVTKAAKKVIAQFAETIPLRVYVLAAKRNWEHEMRAAAFAALQHPIQEMYVQELEDLRAGVYFRLLAYHRLCGKAAAALVTNLRWMAEIAVQRGWEPSWGTCTDRACKEAEDQPSTWFLRYVSAVTQAVRIKPRSKTLEDPTLMDVALVRAATCNDCRHSALADLRTFNLLLGNEIEKKVDDIQLEMK